jgi:neuronal growth regulator 1
MESKMGSRYSLTIRRVRSQDFGNFSCVAKNQLGSSAKTVTLSGLPRAPQIRSTTLSQWRDKYNISWSVDSYAPIEEYKLFYKLLINNNHLGSGYQNHLDMSMDHKEDSALYSSHANYVR